MSVRIPQGAGGDPKTQFLSSLINSGLTISGIRAAQAAMLRASATPLPADAQKVIDTSVARVGLSRLTVVQDLMSAGLTYNLPNPLSVLEIQWDSISEAGGAQRTMTPSARGQNQLPGRSSQRLPVYLTTDDFFIGIRTLEASKRVGVPLDTSGIEMATRRVNEAIEDSVINGATLEGGADLQVNGNKVPGLLNAPNANQYAITVPWTTATGDQILADVLNMIAMEQADKKFGPYALYVNTTVGNALNKDFKAGSTGSILSRVQQISNGAGGTLTIKTADMLPANKVVLVQLTNDVIDLVVGQAPTAVPWTSPDGFTFYWLVMGIIIPRVRSDYNGASGICIGTWTGTLLDAQGREITDADAKAKA
jgi:uncharacterized linocin/CFP29 family protein